MPLRNLTYADAFDVLTDENIKSVVIATHNSPDGDAIGSICALEKILKDLGKEVELIFQTRVCNKYKNIVGKDRANRMLYPKKKKYDLSILLDTSNENMTYSNIGKLGNRFMVIDHHSDRNIKCDYYLNNEDSSTGITIYEIFKDKIIFDEFVSTCIYLSIISDTDCFKNYNTDSKAYLVSYKMIKNNADFSLANSIHNNISENYIKLLSKTLNKIAFLDNKKISYLIISEDDIRETKCSLKEVGKIIDFLKSISSVETSILLIENNNSVVIRMRSTIIDCSKVMKEFGGGGHINSAAAIVRDKDVYDLKDEIIRLLS